MFRGENLLGLKMEASDAMSVMIRDVFQEIWNSSERPDIKPGRTYVLKMELMELPDEPEPI